ncbi:unnamed protein product [Pedinophyceae sp. YPF-701]|nr:unnamed protein product [Pedinophyceae sp. YPF-701]
MRSAADSPRNRGMPASPRRARGAQADLGVVSEYDPAGHLTRSWRGGWQDAAREPRGAAGGVSGALTAAFLPAGYPTSVTDDYLPFQTWDTAQGLCSYVRGSLTSHALLRGVGVGAAAATAVAATFQFILKDMAGMLGGICFASAAGASLDKHAKQWRLFADLMNNVGLFMELLSPSAGAGAGFLLLASAGAMARSVTGVAAGATRVAMTSHFARQGYVGRPRAARTDIPLNISPARCAPSLERC